MLVQGALKRAIEDVTGALSRERLQSSALQAELRSAVEAYRSVLPDANGTEAHALQVSETILASLQRGHWKAAEGRR